MEQNFLPRIHPKTSRNKPQKIIKVKSTNALKPYCLITTKEYQNILNNEKNIITQSIYKDGYYYMSEYEKEKLENSENKRKFLAGEFHGYSGTASAMPLRKDGLIRTGSRYLSPIQPHPKDKSRPLYGIWRQT